MTHTRRDIMTNTKALADEIAQMLDLRSTGVLKRSADDFISGLIKAYSLVTDEDDLDQAQANALKEAQS
jgi:hypothetical protein